MIYNSDDLCGFLMVAVTVLILLIVTLIFTTYVKEKRTDVETEYPLETRRCVDDNRRLNYDE